MGWVYREVEQHRCEDNFPKLAGGLSAKSAGITTGDLWRCEEPDCGALWRVDVRHDQRDGDWLEFYRSTPIPPSPATARWSTDVQYPETDPRR